MKLGAKILGVLAGVLALFLLVGLLLPGEWEAEAEAEFSHRPEEVFPFLDRMESWARWTGVPDSGSVLFGPAEGPGAGIRWDDPRYGSGQVRITASHPHQRVEYLVEVEGGAMRITGVMRLAPVRGGTRIRWTEEGDFGANPLLGYAARGMPKSQSEAMRAGLERLRDLLEGK